MVIADVAVLPSDVAVIVALPTATPVTTPVDETVAFAASDVDQVMVRPVNAVPATSATDALRATVLPRTSWADAGVTVMRDTGAVTLTRVESVAPMGWLATTNVDPWMLPARTNPLSSTVATVALRDT